MSRQFYHTYTVRYDECNSDGVLTPIAFLRYMQDVAALDAEDARLVGEGYWVVKRTHIAFAAPVPVHTKLELKTYGMRFTRITAQRGYDAYIVGEGEKPIISANTLWVYVDAHGRPIRLPEETSHIWLPDGPLPQPPEPPFPAMPETTPEMTSLVVRYSDIDLMRHLNNASAVEMLDDASWQVYAQSGILPDTATFDVLSYEIEYVDSPRFGQQLEIQSWLEPLPMVGHECSRFQQITCEGKIVVRAFSRWLYKNH